jgi:hypothetical protein
VNFLTDVRFLITFGALILVTAWVAPEFSETVWAIAALIVVIFLALCAIAFIRWARNRFSVS